MKNIIFNTKYIILISLIGLIGCQQTKIITNSGVDTEIYVNGKYKGMNMVEVKRRGLPKKSYITAKQNGEVVSEMSLKRKFYTGAIVGIYFLGPIYLVNSWQYPKEVKLELKQESDSFEVNPWKQKPSSAWQQNAVSLSID